MTRPELTACLGGRPEALLADERLETPAGVLSEASLPSASFFASARVDGAADNRFLLREPFATPLADVPSTSCSLGLGRDGRRLDARREEEGVEGVARSGLPGGAFASAAEVALAADRLGPAPLEGEADRRPVERGESGPEALAREGRRLWSPVSGG